MSQKTKWPEGSIYSGDFKIKLKSQDPKKQNFKTFLLFRLIYLPELQEVLKFPIEIFWNLCRNLK